jgi:hypothetical protein
MKLLDRLTQEQKTQLRDIGLVYIAWVVISIFSWCFVLPKELLWLAYGPVLFAMLAVGMTAALILARHILPKPIKFVYIGRRRVTCCQYCPMAEVKDNPVFGKMPIVKCRETARVCYSPMQIPGWCPYAD